MTETDEKTLNQSLQSLSTIIIRAPGKEAEEEEVEVILEMPLPPRAHLMNWLKFMLCSFGYVIGLSNLWRFPWYCYKNGGGAFLLAYTVCTFLMGMPILLLESSIGQLLGRRVLDNWSMVAPLWSGIGYAGLVISFFFNLHYIVVIAWSLYYMVIACQFELPWAFCNTTSWSVPECSDWILSKNNNYSLPTQLNGTAISSVEDFWRHQVAMPSTGGLLDPGTLHGGVSVCLVIAWMVCHVSLIRTIEFQDKISYFVVACAYVGLLLLMIRALILPGASLGILYYLTPQMKQLLNPNLWLDAAGQVFYSLGLGIGSWMIIASYNRVHNNLLRDVLIISTTNYVIAFVVGLTVFSTIGFLSQRSGKPVDRAVPHDTGLVFIIYPAILSQFGGALSTILSMFFFTLLVVMGLGEQFASLECFIAPLLDHYSVFLANRRQPFVSLIIFGSIVIGLLFLFQWGIYWFVLFDFFSVSGYSILIIVLCESIAVGWFYGADIWAKNIEQVFRDRCRVNYFWRFSWRFMVPSMCMAIIIGSLFDLRKFEYDNYRYPLGGILVGICLAMISILCIPIHATEHCARSTNGSYCERLRHICTSKYENVQKRIMARIKLDDLLD